MKFPQYSKLFADYLIGAVALAAACVFCLFFTLRDGEVGISILLSVVAIGNIVGMLLGWRAEKQKEICIDETGISLTKKGKPEWVLRWDQIQRIAYGSKFCHRSVFFVPKEQPKMDLLTVCSPYKYEFHLNKTAKEALACYCPLSVER